MNLQSDTETMILEALLEMFVMRQKQINKQTNVHPLQFVVK